jgi:hypothetical protein
MATTPADYALQAVKGIKKSFDNACKYRIEQYMEQGYLQFYNTPEVSEIYTSTEGMSGVTELGVLETPPALNLEDGYSVTITEERFGGAIVLPEKVYRRDGQDSTWKVNEYLKRQRNQLLKTSTQKIMTNSHLMLNEAFDSGSAYLAPDSVEVCGTHSWNSGATFDNAVTASLDSDAYDAAWEYAGAYTDPAGKEDPLNWSHIVVKKGSAAHREAIKLFAKDIVPTAVNDINIYEGELTVIETPYITTANKNYWFLMDLTMELSPLAVGIGDYPTLREPIKLDNEAYRTNATGFWKQGVINMPYQVYGSDGTT